MSLAPVKSRLVLPFWYRLTWVVLDRGPLNGCVCVCVCGGEWCHISIWRVLCCPAIHVRSDRAISHTATSRHVSSFFLRVQLSQPYIATGHTSNFVVIFMLWLFHIFYSDAPSACSLFILVRWSTNSCSSSSEVASRMMSSAYRRFVTILPPD